MFSSKIGCEEFVLRSLYASPLIKPFVTPGFHPTIKFTAEISEIETIFLDTVVYKGDRFLKESILDVRTHFKPTETFQYTNFYSLHPPGVTKGFIKGEALRLLRTNSSQPIFEENIRNFAVRLKNRGYPAATVEKHLSEIKFSERKTLLSKKNRTAQKKILPLSHNTTRRYQT